MQTYLFSCKGPRVTNQDAVSLTYLREGVLLCVADGVGGNQGGEVASKLAIETFTAELVDPDCSFKRALEKAHQVILERAGVNVELEGMATTFTAVFIERGTIKGVHCGDSRAYILRDKGLKQLTSDHSEVAKLVREGKLSKEAALDYPRRNVIYSALGSHKELEIEEFEFDVQSGDRLMLTTDGIHGVASKITIRDASLNAASLKEWCDMVVTMVEGLGAEDNYSLVALEMD